MPGLALDTGVKPESASCPGEPGCPLQPAPSAQRGCCPRCGSDRIQGHGSFSLKNGTCKPRQLCRTCGRTFNRDTGTPLHYLKKRDQWARLGEAMARKLSVRSTAAELGIQVETAFKWRHRLLSPLSGMPQPKLAGSVIASEVYIPYSEKGRQSDTSGRNRRYMGTPGRRPKAGRSGADLQIDTSRLPDACGRGGTTHGRRFRRLIDGRPVCVLLASAGKREVSDVAGRGRLGVPDLQACLSRFMDPGAELSSHGLAPYAEACRNLCLPHSEAAAPRTTDGATATWRHLDRLRRQLLGWLLCFRGVATRYLHHYLAWHRFAKLNAALDPEEAGRLLLTTVATLPPR